MFVPTGGNEAAAFTQGLDTSGRRCFGARATLVRFVIYGVAPFHARRTVAARAASPPKEAERRIRPSMSPPPGGLVGSSQL